MLPICLTDLLRRCPLTGKNPAFQRVAALAMRGGRCQSEGCTSHVHGLHCLGHDHHGSAWGHAHGPEPAELAGAGGWCRGLSAVVAVGLRPCSGAFIVLIFALAQNLFWTGVGATLIMGLGTAATVAAIATVAVSARQAASRVVGREPGSVCSRCEGSRSAPLRSSLPLASCYWRVTWPASSSGCSRDRFGHRWPWQRAYDANSGCRRRAASGNLIEFRRGTPNQSGVANDSPGAIVGSFPSALR
jgi:High-affinity nickel-transport protein